MCRMWMGHREGGSCRGGSPFSFDALPGRERPMTDQGQTRRSGAVSKAVIAAAAVAALLQPVPARAEEKAPKPPGALQVKVRLADGKDFKECKIYAKDQAATLTKDKKGYLFAGLAEGFYAVTADATVGQGWFASDARYIGVEQATIISGKTAEVTITLTRLEDADGKRIEDFCSRCHPPPNGVEIKPGQIKRDVHASGIPYPAKKREQMEKKVVLYNQKIDALIKDKKAPPPYRLKLDEREIMENDKQVKRKFFTCESCHTPHIMTPYTKYAINHFRDRADLCLGCHGG